MKNGRFAPSNTGSSLHLGNVRTALYSYLICKKYKSDFIVRIEDTDAERSKQEYANNILEQLSWLKLDWIGAGKTDDDSQYYQSKRGDIYNKYINQLLDEGKAYHCFCTSEELEQERLEQEQAGIAPKYSGKCKNLTKEQIQEKLDAGLKPSIRLKNDGKDFIFTDSVYGDLRFQNDVIGDIIIMRPNGLPVFNFSNVIDDIEMKIGYVVRGMDHLNNMPTQLLVYRSVGAKLPQFAHLPMVLGEDGQKLSKRNGVAGLQELKELGYLPSAILNAIFLLGFSHPEQKEVLTIDEMIESFDICKVHRSPARFDIDKLNFLNKQHISKLSHMEYTECLVELMENDPEFAKDVQKSIYMETGGAKFFAMIDLFKESLTSINELKTIIRNFPSVKSDLIIEIQNTELSYKEFCSELTTKTGLKGKDLFIMLRKEIAGVEQGPAVEDLFNAIKL